MSARNGVRTAMILAVGAIGLASIVSAQVQTSTKTTNAGAATHQVQVQKATVVAVSGNDLILKMQDGTLKHIANVPPTATATVDGKQITIKDVKPGMTLEKTITTTTTPKVITTTQSVTGKVWYVNPPLSVILTLEDGKNQEFKIPKGQKFNVDGQMVDAWGLKKGMTVTATKVVEQPETVVQQQAKLSGSMPPPPPPPPPDQPILVAVLVPVPVPEAAPAPAPAPAPTMPKTGSELPLTALLGLLSLAGSAGVRMYRKVRG
jgi:LPXTG-motif cell wall-anchored protein